MTFELILSTESKVLSTNIQTFEQQANQYLATLTQTFETDDDFAKAKNEIKELKEIETKIKTAIDNVTNGNQEIATLLETAEAIAERFRQERLEREKRVKNREAEIKEEIAQSAIADITETRNRLANTSDLSLALEMTISKDDIAKRIKESQKNIRSINSLHKAVNAEKNLIIAEITAEILRLTARLEQLNAKCSWLFPDAAKLIASQDDLAPIIAQRIAEEEKREAEIKAQAEQEAQAKTEAEIVKAEANTIAEEMAKNPDIQAVEKSPKTANSSSEETEPTADFVVTIRLNHITQSQAITIARSLKERFGENVSLNKAK